MEQFSAGYFYLLGKYFVALQTDMFLDPYKQEVLFDPTRLMQPVGEAQRNKISENLKQIARMCSSVGLTIATATAQQFAEDISNKPLAYQVVSQRVSNISDVIEKEFKDRLFMYIPADRASYYDKDSLFGDEVRSSFPSAAFDIMESGNCYAAACYTATVFHLMRVLEIGLSVLAGQFGVPADHTNWHNIIEQIEAKVRTMGSDPNKVQTWKEDQEFYSQAASHFMIVKDAWRNYTAHARGKYSQEQALSIMMNVRVFMQTLSKRLREKTQGK
jgi:hypothetical protein